MMKRKEAGSIPEYTQQVSHVTISPHASQTALSAGRTTLCIL